jgi:hypothetical protein
VTTDTAQTARSSVPPPPVTRANPSPKPGPQDDAEPDLYADIAAYLDGGLPEPPTPCLLRRSDGAFIFYASQVNYLFGDPESGKTFVALAAAVEALQAGRRVLVLDLDHNGVESTVARLVLLGAPLAALRERALFRYAEPEDEPHLRKIVRDMTGDNGWRPAVAVVDSVGELLPLLRLSSNSPDDFTTAHSTVLKPLARAGASVIAIDHLAKNSDSRSWGATGTAAKRRAIGGASLRVTLLEAFAPGQGGKCRLDIHKDRHGGLRKNCVRVPGSHETPAAVFTLEDCDGRTEWTVRKVNETDRPATTDAPEADVAALQALDPEPQGVRDVKERMGWGSTRASAAMSAWRSRNVPGTGGTT